MKIATYNIWNSSRGMPKRLEQIIQEVKDVDADIIAMQEVEMDRLKVIVDRTDYDYHCMKTGTEDCDGLAVLSRYPMSLIKEGKYSLFTSVEYMGMSIALVNLHLPYDSTLEREFEIIQVEASVKDIAADFKFVMGDYNCSEESSVYRFMTSDMSLHGKECDVYWIDLAMVAEERYGVTREMTLDLMRNPRWKTGNVCDCSSRVDLIFMHDCYPVEYPVMKSFRYFGKTIDEEIGLSPSDHYGVVVEFDFDHIGE